MQQRKEARKYLCNGDRNNKYWKVGKSGLANKLITPKEYLVQSQEKN